MKKQVLRAAMQIERWSDAIKKLWRTTPPNYPILTIFEHYATTHQIIVKGRALCETPFPKAQPTDAIWLNFHRTLRWANSHELPNEAILIEFQKKTYTTQTDEEGYFYKKINLEEPISYQKEPHQFTIQLTQYPESKTQGMLHLPPTNAQVGIVSDIDDTVMVSNVGNPLSLLLLIFFRNSTTRRTFEGVSKWYQRLRISKTGQANNPFFYVSSSPWNLYHLIKNVLSRNQLPDGTLLLQDYGIDDRKFIIGTHKNHKAAIIQTIFETYPNMQFVLIGDSSQRDIWIYTDLKRQFPERIAAIYIRNVGLKKTVKKALKEAKNEGIDIQIIKDSHEGLAHTNQYF